MPVMMMECSYCSTPVKPTLEKKTIIECSFCGRVISEEEEWEVLTLKRKLRGLFKKIGKRRRVEVEREQSCVTSTDYLADQSDLSDTGSTASKKVVVALKSSPDAPSEPDGTGTAKSAE